MPGSTSSATQSGVAATSQTSDAVSASPAAKKSRWRWARRIGITLAILAIPVVAGDLYLRSVDREAKRFFNTGSSLNAYFAQSFTAFAAGELDTFMGGYADDVSFIGPWEPTQSYPTSDDTEVPWTEYRWAVADGAADQGFSGVREWASALQASYDVFDKNKFAMAKILSYDENRAEVLGTLWLRGSSSEFDPQETKLKLRIALSRDGEDWKISEQELQEGTTVVGDGQTFTDIAKQMGIEFESTINPLYKEPQWEPRTFGIMKYATAGVATADYDNDSWYDIFFCDGTSPRLYRNDEGHRFVDVTEQAGLSLTDLPGTHVALFVDLDNDGDKELFLGRSTGPSKLYSNNGDGTFTDVTEQANLGRVWVATASAADVDNDGFVDLYLGRYLDPRTELPTTNFYTRNGQGNTLLHNDGDLTFTDVTDEAGMREGGLTLAIAFADADLDGDQDCYVANDFGRNAYLRNKGDGTFEDASIETGTVDFGYGMGVSWADIDNDGDLDLYVGNVHSGQRWFASESTLWGYIKTSIRQGTIIDDWPLYREMLSFAKDLEWDTFIQQFLKGSSLYLNNGDGTFAAVGEESGGNPHGWYWSTAVFDFDQDGFQDIYCANGWITGPETDDL